MLKLMKNECNLLKIIYLTSISRQSSIILSVCSVVNCSYVCCLLLLLKE